VKKNSVCCHNKKDCFNQNIIFFLRTDFFFLKLHDILTKITEEKSNFMSENKAFPFKNQKEVF